MRRLQSEAFPSMLPQEALEVLDAGRAGNDGKPDATIRFANKEIANFRKDSPPQTILGFEQKTWFLNRLKSSTVHWKIWGSSLGTPDGRMDPQNLPAGITRPWAGAGYAVLPPNDHSGAYLKRAEIYSHIRKEGIGGFATVCGDRHGFWAGLASAALPCEFVCIARPVERVTEANGGLLLYRVVHRAPLWKRNRRPSLEQRILEGDPRLSI